MAKQPLPLTAYTEDQRVQAHERFVLIRPFLEEGVPLTQIAEAQHLPLRTARRWVAAFRTYGLAGLVRQARSDRGKRRGLPTNLSSLIEGLRLTEAKALHCSNSSSGKTDCRGTGLGTPKL